MPITQRRPLMLIALAAICAAMFAFSATSASAEEDDAKTHPILARAFQDLGTWQGQCWTWMREVVQDATGRTVGFDYRLGFFQAGAVEVSAANAGPGDIIQIADLSYTAPDASYAGLHTAIIVKNNGNGTFDVIDSNSQWDGVVRTRMNYDPWWSAGRYGIDVSIYRIGEYEGVAPAPKLPESPVEPAEPVEPPVNGDYATVNTPGECLNLRPAASTVGQPITCLAHGTRLQLISEPVVAGGRTWVQVSSPSGTGWVAAEFLKKAEPPANAPPPPVGVGSGVSPTPPATSFRLFIGGVGADR